MHEVSHQPTAAAVVDQAIAPGILGRLRQRLRDRPDSEHEMTANRLVLSGVVLAYLAIASWYGSESAQEMLRTTGIYFAVYQGLSLALFCHILYRPGVSVARRMCGIALDVGMFSYAMYAGGEATAPFFPIYLWVIFGNGFRFGNPYLLAAAGASIVLFGAVALTNEYWRTHLSLAAGLLASLVFLPLYVAVLIRKLSAAKRQAEQANRAKGAFLASISHELRTPLNAIIGLGGLLRDQTRDPEHRHMVQTIVNSGRSLLDLINSILDFSRIEAGRMPINLVEVDFYAAIRRIEAMLAVQAQSKSLMFAVHVTARTPQRMLADFGHIEQILLNLAANAIKFTESGYVVVTVDAVHVDEHRARLRFDVTDAGIGIAPEAQTRIFESFTQADSTIIDQYGGTGLGLAISKQLVRLLDGEIGLQSTPYKGSTFWFEVDAKPLATESAAAADDQAFILLSRDPDIQEAPTGLPVNATVITDANGVLARLAHPNATECQPIVLIDARELTGANAITDDLLRAMRDSSRALIAITEMPGPGSLAPAVRLYFASSLALPVNPRDLAQAVRISDTAFDAADNEFELDPALSTPDRSLSILVAEDNRTNQMVIAKILERAGHAVEVVKDGQAAFDALIDKTFDIVLMDVNMPVMNGIETTKLYRFAALGRARIPIIALTADATEETERRCIDAGMDACVTKPVEPARLTEIIDALVPIGDTGTEAVLAPVEAVTDIASHPRFRSDAAASLDGSKLDDLMRLGGAKFLYQLKQQFLNDAGNLIREVESALRSGDAVGFQDRVHALRSNTANIGAQRLHAMCLSWRQFGPAEIAAHGDEIMAKLNEEFERVRAALSTSRDGERDELGDERASSSNILKLTGSLGVR